MGEAWWERPELLAAFRAGERAALAEVVRAHVQELAELVRRGFFLERTAGVRVPGLAEPSDQCDLIRETFARAFSEGARQAYDGRSPYRGYLLRIAKNLMTDGLRLRDREVPRVADAVDETPEPALLPEDPALLAHRAGQQAMTRSFVAGLRCQERAVYELRFQAGLGQLETALKMGVTPRRVRILEGRLLQGLRRYLKSVGLWP